jgi:hypothetical protein
MSHVARLRTLLRSVAGLFGVSPTAPIRQLPNLTRTLRGRLRWRE